MGISFSVDVNMDDILAKLEGAPAEIMKALEQGMHEVVGLIQTEAKGKAPNGPTGDLEASIQKDVDVNGTSVEGKVFTELDYAGYVEMGTGPVGAASPHPSATENEYSTSEYIFTRTLKNGKTVRFVTDGWVYPIDGGYRFTRGQPARPFMYPAMKENEDKIPGMLAAAIKEALGCSSERTRVVKSAAT